VPHEQKNLGTPEQVVDMERGKIEIVSIAGGGIGRATFQPGWKWSVHERPVVGGGEFCDVPHFVYIVAGQLHIVMADGEQFDLRAGEVATLPAGHDGWVVGDETAVMLDFSGVAK
jgi:mannose-6-phosphate isomerase-like protein (cupin superfamily)